ncbi:hypothetical protein [Tenacibaculum xiamenense]|uniref:hypothetical protein n=1 Tax=Tenacibaculum xiamenense TaxID=1261553 RepID=UPI0038961705
MKLLPHRFKKIGLCISPIGFLLWIFMQRGQLEAFANYIGLTNPKALNTPIAIIGFFSFLFGIYASTFSKERIEDEMIQSIRLESFQFAALTQIIFIILGFIGIGIKNPSEVGLMLFFIVIIFIFWLTYLVRFNYVLHFKKGINEE